MDRRSYLKTTAALGAGLLLPAGVLALAGRSEQRSATLADVNGFNGRTMGTGYSVRLIGEATTELHDAVASSLDNTDAHMSTWQSSAELVRLNHSTDTDWQPLSAETATVLDRALATSRASAGAFDSTVGPLVDLWGFGPKTISTLPRERDLSGARDAVGFALIELDRAGRRVRKHRTDTALDLSGIAKGHGVDRVAAVLDAHGVENYLVEVGGELRSRGTKPNGSAWRVAIERPDAGARDVFRVLNLDNAAIATSGNYRNFFDRDGQRFAHTIDPRTARPVEHELASVSVIAANTMDADAWSTALMVLGPEDGLALAEREGLAAHLILKSDAGLSEHWTAGFESFIDA